MFDIKKSALGTLAAVAAFAATPGSAAQLIQNGGFETGNFQYWTLSGNTGFTGVDAIDANTGSFGAFAGAIGSTGTISQYVHTITGHVYHVSFDLANDSTPAGSQVNSFLATFGGSVINSGTNFPAASYATLSPIAANFIAAGNYTLVSFTFRNDPGFFSLDNVSVLGDAGPVPEPSTWLMLLSGFALTGVLLRRRTRKVSAFA
jgi:hypothetical protein